MTARRAGLAVAAVAVAVLPFAPASAGASTSADCANAYHPANQPPFGGQSLPPLEPQPAGRPAPGPGRTAGRPKGLVSGQLMTSQGSAPGAGQKAAIALAKAMLTGR